MLRLYSSFIISSSNNSIRTQRSGKRLQVKCFYIIRLNIIAIFKILYFILCFIETIINHSKLCVYKLDNIIQHFRLFFLCRKLKIAEPIALAMSAAFFALKSFAVIWIILACSFKILSQVEPDIWVLLCQDHDEEKLIVQLLLFAHLFFCIPLL